MTKTNNFKSWNDVKCKSKGNFLCKGIKKKYAPPAVTKDTDCSALAGTAAFGKTKRIKWSGYTEKLSFAEASNKCKSWGGNLAKSQGKILSQYDELKKLFNKYEFGNSNMFYISLAKGVHAVKDGTKYKYWWNSTMPFI